jgi:2-dehydro-3-deoxyphosphogluconate aldolase/(4S)-4-hydroxy-2-oxoglutarate aldolase
MSVQSIMAIGPVIPVVIIENIDDAIPLADALAEGGIGTIEITLRSVVALNAIALISKERPGMTIGAGTVLNPLQMRKVQDAGADFVVSPGVYPELLGSAKDGGIAFLPGAATASEMMLLLANGLTAMKFFPATSAGGPGYLKALASPLADVVFCPTGGITAKTAMNWLSLPNVRCVGGSWVAPKDMLAKGDFGGIAANAMACSALG